MWSLIGSTNIFYGEQCAGEDEYSGGCVSVRNDQVPPRVEGQGYDPFREDESHIETVVEKNGISYQIDMHLKKNSPKGIAINKMPIRKASELFGL